MGWFSNFFSSRQDTRTDGFKSKMAFLLAASDGDFVRVVKDMILRMPPVGRAHCVVAYQNLKPLLEASLILAQRDRTGQAPTSIEGHIRLMSESLDKAVNNSLVALRIGYFLQAALVKRSAEVCEKNPAIKDHLIETWIGLAEGCVCLNTVLSENNPISLWNKEEKIWFALNQTEKSSVEYCLNFCMPKSLENSKEIRAFKRRHKLDEFLNGI